MLSLYPGTLKSLPRGNQNNGKGGRSGTDVEGHDVASSHSRAHIESGKCLQSSIMFLNELQSPVCNLMSFERVRVICNCLGSHTHTFLHHIVMPTYLSHLLYPLKPIVSTNFFFPAMPRSMSNSYIIFKLYCTLTLPFSVREVPHTRLCDQNFSKRTIQLRL